MKDNEIAAIKLAKADTIAQALVTAIQMTLVDDNLDWDSAIRDTSLIS